MHKYFFINCSIAKLCKFSYQTVRWYRFQNRVAPRGFYYSHDFESNKKFLKSRKPDQFSAADLEELRRVRNEIFEEEKKRQADLIARIEKIEVEVNDIPPSINETPTITLLMNKNISTPYHCAQHIHQLFMKRSVLAEINDGKLWDMHRPLNDNCQLRYRHFKEKENSAVNKAFWRSCSFLFGMVIERAFKDEIQVNLHSWPKPYPQSGSFVYDVELNLDNWHPKHTELRVFTSMLNNIIKKDLIFQRLEVESDLAKKIFEYNKIKLSQIDDIAKKNQNMVTLYRLDDHIDISGGPMIANTSQIGIINATAIHQVNINNTKLYRFQGIALPNQLSLSPFTYNIIKEQAKKLNTSGLIKNYQESNQEKITENAAISS